MATKRVEEIKDAGIAAGKSMKSVVIEQPHRVSVALEVEGAALIQNNFSQKSVEQMLRKHMGLPNEREKKKPREVVEAATIRNTNGKVCIPPTAFKKAMLTAATSLKGLKKTQLRTAMFIEGFSIPIKYEAMIPRMDMVRTGGFSRAPDVRFRPEFQHWKARMLITFIDTMNVQTVVDLLNRAGSVGVGEWRPEKDGTYGTFRVVRSIDDMKEINEIRDICSVPLVPLVIPEWAMDVEIDSDILAKIMKSQAAGTPVEGEEAEEAEPESGEKEAV